jgi:hypothetical protein
LAGLDRGPAHQGGALFICGYLDIKSAGDPRLTCFSIFFFRSSSMVVGCV